MTIQTVLQNCLASFLEFLPKLISGLVIFFVALIGSNYVAKWVRKLVSKRVDNGEMLQLVYMLTKWGILIIGTILALDQVDFNVTGFVAGLGVVGFTIGFALQDIAKNFISGLMLLSRTPFHMEDFVRVADFEGKVKEINVRDTVIQTLDGELVIIPNNKVFENPIINYTDAHLRRRTIMIGLGYEEDTERTVEIFIETIKSVSGVESDPAPVIQAVELGDSAMMLSASFWVDHQKNNLVWVHSEVVKALKIASDRYNIHLPYPVQTVYVKNLDV